MARMDTLPVLRDPRPPDHTFTNRQIGELGHVRTSFLGSPMIFAFKPVLCYTQVAQLGPESRTSTGAAVLSQDQGEWFIRTAPPEFHEISLHQSDASPSRQK